MGAFRDRARKWWRDMLTNMGEIDLTTDAKLLVDQVRTDRQLRELFLDEFLETEIRRIGEQIAGTAPRVARTGTTVKTIASLRAEVEAEAAQHTTWLPDEPPVPSITLLSMTQGEVIKLATRYAYRAHEYAGASKFLRTVAVRMTPSERVKDVFTLRDLEALRQTLDAEQRAAMFREPAQPQRIA
ncbi:MAG TPA: hypothetical protein VGC41_22750 [Kofleriaceae bacterium]